jgi:hypothetical protein
MTKKIRTINDNLNAVTLADIENHKSISDDELRKDIQGLKNYDAAINSNSFHGNAFLYHHQLKNLLKCRRQDGRTIYDVWADDELKDKLLASTKQRNRGGRTAAGNIFECFRINLGAVVMFKATTAKYLYHKYSATSVLDPTAGWGGRMLAAHSLGIAYTGIDTNIEMRAAYDSMIEFLNRPEEINDLFTIENTSPELKMIWQDCLSVDFGEIEYDFVLTSPPYVNLEIYQHMVPWSTDDEFYLDFFIPLYHKCRQHIKPGGHIAFNISPKMYDRARALGLPICCQEEDLLQQMGQKKNKKRQDKIYVWNC